MAREQSLESEPWHLIDPDPECLSQLCVQMGVQGVQVEELRSLTWDSFCDLRPVHGILLLIRQAPEKYQRDDVYTTNHNIYFANQVVNNAYALYALLSVLLNCSEDIDLGDKLIAFKQFTDEFSPALKGLGVTNSKELKDANNSVSRTRHRPQSRYLRQDTYHYISYVPIGGYLWELDGLKRGPLRLAPCTKNNWFDAARAQVQRKLDLCQRQQIPVTLLSVIEDRRRVYQRRILGKGLIKISIEQQLDRHDSQWRAAVRAHQWEEEYKHAIESERQKHNMVLPALPQINPSLVKDKLPPDEYAELMSEIQGRVENRSASELTDLWLLVQDESFQLYKRLGDEHVKHQQYQHALVRRQHDYIPFIVSYIECLAAHGHLRRILNEFM